jgi:hypothetical protein
MTNVLKKAVCGLTAASSLAVMATPADAQYYNYRRHHGDDTAIAVGAGILGLGIGAAIASSNRGGYYGNGYYGNSYYSPGYSSGYYDRGYYGSNYGYGYGSGYGGYGYGDGYYDGNRYDDGYGYGDRYARRCTTRWEYDPYRGRQVRVRYC